MKQAATKKANPTAGMTVAEEIEYARENGWNLLLPETHIGELSQFHKAVTDKVTLSSNPDDGDVYPGKTKGSFALHARGLYKLSLAAGISWDAAQCRRTDDRSCRDYVSFQAVGGIRKADGTVLTQPGEYDIDMEVEEEEIYIQKFNTAQKFKDATDEYRDRWIRDAVKKDLLKKRRHKLKLAETGAMNRVIRKFLAIKAEYTKEELLKPFLVIRIILQPNFDDDEFRDKMMVASIQAITGVYGAPVTPRQLPAPSNGDVIDVPTAEELPTEDEDLPPETKTGDAKPTALESFLDGEDDERIRHLEELAKKKGVDLDKIVTVAWKHFAEKNFIKLFEHLMDQPDDDIPF